MPTPRSVSKIKESLLRPALTSQFEVEIPFPQGDFGLKSFIGAGQDNLNLRCSNASLPGSNLATFELNNTYHGVTQRHAYRRVYDDRIDLEFYVDAENYTTIRFFEKWIDAIVLQDKDTDPQTGPISKDFTYRARYIDDYSSASGLKVRKFEKDHATNIEYTFVSAYPFSISSMPISYDSSQLLKCNVSFSYLRYVINETQDSQRFGSKQTPALNKQIAESFADQAAFNSFNKAPIFDLGIAVSAGLDGIMRNTATGEPV